MCRFVNYADAMRKKQRIQTCLLFGRSSYKKGDQEKTSSLSGGDSDFIYKQSKPKKS